MVLLISDLIYDFLTMLSKRLSEIDVSTIVTVLECKFFWTLLSLFCHISFVVLASINCYHNSVINFWSNSCMLHNKFPSTLYLYICVISFHVGLSQIFFFPVLVFISFFLKAWAALLGYWHGKLLGVIVILTWFLLNE